ncbi:putative damage-inducible protein DinB [Salinibacter ruber]|uniref:hypothetical protein n=1 Tax=Salinibacter ruber TaxID=146919 RepID=UPI002167E7E6|nr:hypothetical protein [Salinibacter ruber]MCS3628161.1 putative damage-inducible protein DinB [Salinibacter ruber]MCS3825915.1 putative damage-inducible protein DinB [Salinibacter ruber]MCS4145071.1 putative damage-inducible protein DinB [Salinibacter ruber]MCS4194480.1 putative damage-inducible protein DinB [Salinibacter ruber]
MSAPQSPAADDIQTLFRYTRWANARMLDAMQAAEAVPVRAVELLSHLLRVQDVWFGRVEGTAHADWPFGSTKTWRHVPSGPGRVSPADSRC